MFHITGTLKVKNNEQQVSEKFRKREFVITDNSSQYPQFISFQLTQDKCGLLDAFQVGEEVKVFFNLRGREWKTKEGELKYFNSLEAWKLEKTSGGNYQQNDATEVSTFTNTQEDDLPF